MTGRQAAILAAAATAVAGFLAGAAVQLKMHGYRGQEDSKRKNAQKRG